MLAGQGVDAVKRIFLLMVLLATVTGCMKSGQDNGIERLIEKMQGAEDDRVSAATELVEIGKPAVGPLLGLLKHGNRRVRSWTAWALGSIGDKSAVEPLVKVLSDEDRDVRQKAARALGRIGDGKAASTLDELWKKDSHGVVRAYAASAVVKLNGSEAALEFLLRQLRSGEDSQARSSAASALGDTDSKKAVEPLIHALEDPEKNVRICAIQSLGEIGDEKALETLALGLKDSDSSIRRYAAQSLGHIKDKRAIEALVQALQDKDDDVRWHAVESLGETGDETAIEPLIKALDDRSGLVRVAATESLEKITGKGFGRDFKKWKTWHEGKGVR
jgi:HEAT repeat protein